MPDSIQRLKEIFRESGISNLRALNGLPAKQRARLDAAVYAWFYSFKSEHVRILTETPGLNLCLGLNRSIGDEMLGEPMETVVKKLSFFSTTGVLLTPKFRHPGCRGKLIPDAWYYLAINYLPLVEAGILAVLPKGITYLVEEGFIQGETFVILGDRSRRVERNWFLFEEEIPSLKVVDLSERALRAQMLEIAPNAGRMAGAAGYINLPHLSNLSVDLLVSMRRHHGDLFSEYNRAVESFFSETSKARTVRKFLEVMQETDARIHKIKTDLDKISSAQVIQRMGIGLKTTLAVLCSFSPNPLIKAAAALAGGNVISNGMKYIQLQRDKKAVLKSSPFYFPWLVYQRSQTLRPS